MKKTLCTILAMIMILSSSSQILASAAVTGSDAETANEFAVFTDITADQLLDGYSAHPDLNQDKPVILAVDEMTEPSPHLRVSGRFGDGDSPQFNIYLPPKADWEGRFFQLLHPFLEIDAVDETLGFHFDSGGYSITIPSFTMGFSSAASAAHLSRTIAKNYYDYDDKIYGYVYGGSGGSFQTIGAMEKTTGVYDGAVPYITAIPIANSYFSIRGFAHLVLGDKAAQIADAVSPGGSGDPYAGLTEMEKSVLEEVTKLGIPLRAWEDYEYLLGIDEDGKTTLLENGMDPDYVDKFWNAPGYLGTEDSELGKLFRELKAAGDYTDAQLSAGSYHRYAVPDDRYYAWDHIREKGYVSFGTNQFISTSNMVSGGAPYDGNINMKTVMVCNLSDVDALPWDGDWYRQRVKESGKEGDFRLWYNENADHLDTLEPRTHRLVQYVGILHQAVRDVSNWVENGVEPAATSAYSIVNGSQISLESNPVLRGGIQPAVSLTANGKSKAEVSTGESVEFTVNAQLTSGGGKVVRAEWDFSGTGDFKKADFKTAADGSVSLSGKFSYDKTGTYFPQIRITTQREGDAETPYANVQNLGRARVVVSEPAKPEVKTHKKYLSGYDDGSFQPDGKLTRAETAALFYNLLEEKPSNPGKKFSDVPQTAWYREGVEGLASIGVINGYEDETFRPGREISRAEFVSMAVNFVNAKDTGAELSFSDMKDTAVWYYNAVKIASGNKWIEGYNDNTFQPFNSITRAEAVSVVNRMLDRSPDKDYIEANAEKLNKFSDLTKAHWGFYDIIEATSEHLYTAEKDAEVWSD